MNPSKTVQLSEYSPGSSPPLSRVHQWQPRDQRKKTDGTNGEKLPSEHLQHLKEIPQAEKNELTAKYSDVKIRQESLPSEKTSVAISKSQSDYSTAVSLQTRPNADAYTVNVNNLPHCSLDAISLADLSKFKLQLKSQIKSPRLTKSTEKVEKNVYHQSTTCINLNSGCFPEIYNNDISIIGDSGITKEDINKPAALTESTNIEPMPVKHEMRTPEMSICQKYDKSYKPIASLCEAALKDCINKFPEPKSTQNTDDVTLVVQPLEEIQLYESLALLQTSNVVSPLPLRETARPLEMVLTPIAVPQIILQRGPTTTVPFRPPCVPLKANKYESAYYKASVTLPLEDAAELQLSPPPYSECIKQTPLPICQQYMALPSLPRSQETRPSFSRDVASINKMCSEMKPHGAGYITVNRDGDRFIQSGLFSSADNRSSTQLSDCAAGVLENDHQLLAFISCLFCWPIGLVAIYYSNMSQMLKSEGNYVQAQVYARQAFIISTLALCSGSITYIIMFIYQRLL